ncbi:MAG TPA: HAMP domain-containing sensor histidine kinase [Thermoanaerobaculia bacterium]|nr:HAMP domain-containing sensor histidine kinase [Thermoanaerobaculia bacterium]
MARKCFMCGGEVVDGILCDKCDKPRKKAGPKVSVEAAEPHAGASLGATPAPQPVPPAASQTPLQAAQQTPQQTVSPAPARRGDSGRHEAAAAAAALPQEDPFPKAPVVPFPVESASPAITSVVNLLVASGVPSVLLGPDRSVKYVSDDARRLFDATHAELATLAAIEARAGIRVGDLTVPSSAGVRIGSRNFIYTVVPMSGGASGAVLVFRHADPMNEAHASFVTYVRETVLGPLRSLRDSMQSAARTRNDHMLAELSATVEQVLSSLELAPEVEEPAFIARPVPTVTDVVRRVAERFRAYADLKGIRLDVDVQELEERFVDHEQLSDSLAIMMENALHYVPASGQVVIGVRWMEHKGKPLLLFFVMDNGPVVPETLRQSIFEPSFAWNPQSSDRTGRGLFKCREFALAHAGSVWVESKTGKACTFFLRVRPDGIR